MGLWSWLRWPVGSDPYYASYDKAMQRIKDEMEKTRARGNQRRQLWARVQARFWAGFGTIYTAVLAYAAWVLRQPHGKFTASEHSVRVLPVLVTPLAAYLLHSILRWGVGVLGRRDAARMKMLEAKLRKMVSELKDSTRYERTLQLLKKYDPDFVPPRLETPPRQLPPPGLQATPGTSMGTRATAAAAGLATGTLQGAGATLLPVLGKLWSHAADKLIADDPVMLGLMRQAQQESEALRQRLAAAEARAAHLAAENRHLRQQLGLPVEEEDRQGEGLGARRGLFEGAEGEQGAAAAEGPAAAAAAAEVGDSVPAGGAKGDIPEGRAEAARQPAFAGEEEEGEEEDWEAVERAGEQGSPGRSSASAEEGGAGSSPKEQGRGKARRRR